jgi:hypothetical protein
VQEGPPTITREVEAPVLQASADGGVWHSGLTEIWYPGSTGEADTLAVRLVLPESGSVEYTLPPLQRAPQAVRVIDGKDVISNWEADATNTKVGTAATWRALVPRAVDGDAGTFELDLHADEDMLRVRTAGYGTTLVPVRRTNEPILVPLDLECVVHVELSAPGVKRVAVAVRRTRDPLSGRALAFKNPTVFGSSGYGANKHLINLTARDMPVPYSVVWSGSTPEDSMSVSNLPANSTLLLVAWHDDNVCTSQLFSTGAPRSTVDVRITWPDVAHTTLEIVDPEGNPVGGAVVRLLDSRNRQDLGAAVSDDSGHLLILGLEESRRYRVSIASSLGYDDTSLPDGELNDTVRRIVVTQAEETSVRCRVIDSTGSPLPAVPVSFCLMGRTTTAMTDGDGMASAKVPAGVDVNAVVYGKRSAEPVVKRLVDGEAVLTMPVPLEVLRVYIASRSADGEVRLRILDGEGHEMHSVSAYAFVNAPLSVNVAPGTYTVVVEWGDQQRQTQVSVATGGPATVRVG